MNVSNHLPITSTATAARTKRLRKLLDMVVTATTAISGRGLQPTNVVSKLELSDHVTVHFLSDQ
jgi:hypothetical protein